MALGHKTGGRQIGTPNKTTAEVRQAIGTLIDGNITELSAWLGNVASGIPKCDPVTGAATADYLVRPNPAKAFELLTSLLEYHIPKLVRIPVVEERNPNSPDTKIFDELIERLSQFRQQEG